MISRWPRRNNVNQSHHDSGRNSIKISPAIRASGARRARRRRWSSALLAVSSCGSPARACPEPAADYKFNAARVGPEKLRVVYGRARRVIHHSAGGAARLVSSRSLARWSSAAAKRVGSSSGGARSQGGGAVPEWIWPPIAAGHRSDRAAFLRAAGGSRLSAVCPFARAAGRVRQSKYQMEAAAGPLQLALQSTVQVCFATLFLMPLRRCPSPPPPT